MNISHGIRVVAAAMVLSTLSFAAGIAGDLSMADPPTFGERVVLRLPPEIPADAARAAPLPPLLSTASAQARPARIQVEHVWFSPLDKPPPLTLAQLWAPKARPDRLTKPSMHRKGG